MKVQVFESYASLTDSYQETGGLTVLDFTNSPRLAKSGFKVGYPKLIPKSQKLRLLDDYIELISEIGNLNNYSLQWLCHPLSEKNELLPDNLLSQLVNYLAFCQFVNEFKGRKLLVLTNSVWLKKNINTNTRQQQAGFLGPYWLSLRETGGQLINDWVFLKEKWRQIQIARQLRQKLSKSKEYVVFRTWFDYRSKPFLERSADVHFGKLPKIIKDKGSEILFFGDIIENFDRIFKDLDRKLRGGVLLNSSLLEWGDLLKAWCFKLLVPFQVRLPSRIIFQGVNVTPVVKNYFNQWAKSPVVANNYLYYLGTKKLLRQIRVSRFYNLFENYAWEKVTNLAVKESDKKVKLIAFQHAQIALGATKFFLGRKEAKHASLPDKIVTLGKVTYRLLLRKNYSKDILVPGCALRHDYQIQTKKIPRRKKGRVLVALWSYERSIEMLNFLYESGVFKSRYRVTVTTHPNYPFDKLALHLNFTFKNDFEISTAPLADNFKRSDVLIYSGTTACLDALANGLPVINVEFGDFISPDPLFLFNDFKWTINKPDQLLSVIKQITVLGNKLYGKLQQEGLNYVGQYFLEVNNKNLQTFTI